ncbi:MAG: hydrogenase [Burkholderiaceae bacterium]|jgi:hydrogenase-1 operon protein HyaE|nr:hydrogenase [Burkholderiaceae bacterium]
MSIELVSTSPANHPPAVHPLIARLCELTGAPLLDTDTVDAWVAAPGRALLVFTEDPVLYRETLDLAVIVPELAQLFSDGATPRFRTGVLLQKAARVVAKRYGFRRWPAVVMLADGKYVGAIDGLRDWQDYVEEMARLITAEPTRAPIALQPSGAMVGGASGESHCH